MYKRQVIALYFDRELGQGSLSARIEEDWQYRTHLSMCKGMIDCCVGLRGEKFREDQPEEVSSAFFTQRNSNGIARTLTYFEERLADLKLAERGEKMEILDIWMVVAVEYIYLRHPEFEIEQNYPRLQNWYEQLKELPCLVATRPPG